MEVFSVSSRPSSDFSRRWSFLGSIHSPSADPFPGVLKRCAHLCTRNVLAQVRVLSPDFPLSKVADEAESQEYLDAIERLEPEVDDLARKIVDNLNIDVSSPDDNA